ncbi:FxLYD domain-containing protein [bacterium]|nr:FxLYD domain-containing protein [bacterium]
MSPVQKTSVAGIETPEYDKQIEADIKSLRRSTRLLALLGIAAFFLLVCLIVFAIYDKALVISESPSFIDIAFVSSKEAKIYVSPATSQHVVATYNRGQPLFLLERGETWARVQSREAMGWIRREDYVTKEERRLAATSRADGAVKMTDLDWNVDEVNNFTVVGKIVNLTDERITNVKVNVNFFDDAGHLISTREVIVSGNQPFRKNVAYNFSLRGNYDNDFNHVSAQVASWSE